jgi:hypothetical protein
MSINDAISDLKGEALAGKPVTVDLLAEISEFYGVNREVLERTFSRSFPDLEAARRSDMATDPVRLLKARIADRTQYYLDLYGVDAIDTFEVFYKVDRYTVIGRTSPTHYLAVRHSDGTGWFIPAAKTVTAQERVA